MKRIIILLIAVTGSVCLMAQTPTYRITARIDDAEGVSFLLQRQISGGVMTFDTVTIKNGTFTFTGGSVPYPQRVNIWTLDKKQKMGFYLENSEITLTGNLSTFNKMKVTGSKTQDEINRLEESLKPVGEKYELLSKEYSAAAKANDNVRKEELSKQLNDIAKQARAIQKKFVIDNPSCFAVADILATNLSDFSTSEVESIIKSMPPLVVSTPAIVYVKEKIEGLRRVELGQKAPEFTLPDTEGKPVSLSSKLGSKILLIDFWAGWCSPCRKENPNVVKVYQEFHSRGFDIIGVSLDRTEAEWKKAIADDNLTWTHVSDLKYWNNAAAKIYSVNSIPANFLLDENGIIIAKNLRGEELYNKVKMLLGTK